MSSNSDDVWVNALLDGNREGIEELYQQFLPRITQFITKNGGTPVDAKDVFQETIIIIFKKAKEENFQLSSSFYTYLYAICRNLWLKRLQKRKTSPVQMKDTEIIVAVDDWENTIEKEERFRLYRKKFRELGKDCQKLLDLFFKRVKMVEIVDHMDYSSVSYAKKRKFQCKEKLIRLVQADTNFNDLV